MIKYIELKTGHAHNGPAWIARVVVSRTGQNALLRDKALHRAVAKLVSGNYFDISDRDEYWVFRREEERKATGTGRVLDTSPLRHPP